MIPIATTAFKRYFRDRSSLFFVFVLPILIIVLVGTSADSQSDSPIAVVESDSPYFDEVIALLPSDGLDIFPTSEEALQQVENNSASALLVFLDDTTIEIRSKSGKGVDARADVDAALATVNRRLQTEAAAAEIGADPVLLEGALAIAPTPIEFESTGADVWGGLDNLTASSLTQTVLFMFLATLTAASFLVEDRQLGMAERKATAPVAASTIIAGEALGRFLITVFQAVLIVVVTSAFFGVSWGDPLATTATIALFALVATGAGILLGTLVDGADAANAIGITGGLVLAALGGAMAPVEIFPDVMQTVARFTPHFWAIDGLQTSLTGGDISTILQPLAILAVYAAVLLTAAVLMFRRRVFFR